MIKNRVQFKLKFKSYDYKLLEFNFLTLIFELKKRLNFLKINKVSYLPYKTKRVCVIRSPFVDKSSKEHFELRVFKLVVLLEFFEPKNVIIEKLLEASLLKILKNQEVMVSYQKKKVSFGSATTIL